MLGDTRFNFAGCSASDLVSHYIPAMTMRCVFAVRRIGFVALDDGLYSALAVPPPISQ